MRKEPSRLVTCIDCNLTFTHLGRGRCSRCLECRKENGRMRSYNHRVKKGLIAKPGVGSGGNQYLEDNSQWKDGRIAYRRLARAASTTCQICGKYDLPSKMCAHHKDENRSNNKPDNLILVCKACHQNVLHPTKRDSSGSYTAESKSRN